jgi:hypothetical protein
MSLQDFMDAMSQEKLSADDLRILNFDELEALLGEDDPTKIASMVMEASGYCDPSVGWLRQFEGTPLHAKAVALAEQDLAVEAERIQRRLAEPKDQDLWTKQDQIRLQKSLLVLELHKSRSQQPEDGEKRAISEDMIRRVVGGSNASQERLGRFADKNLVAAMKKGLTPEQRKKRMAAGAAASTRHIARNLIKDPAESTRKSKEVIDKMVSSVKGKSKPGRSGAYLAGVGIGAAAGLGAVAAKKLRDRGKKKKAEVEYTGHVNNGEAAAPTWPKAALPGIPVPRPGAFDKIEEKNAGESRVRSPRLDARGIAGSVLGGAIALGATGAAIKARDRRIRAKQKEERSKKASIADLARRAAAASSAKRVPISAIKGETTASGLSAVRQGIAAKASKATPAPTDVFRSAAPKKSPFDGTGTATRHAPAAPLPPGSMQSIEFLKKYKMASRR